MSKGKFKCLFLVLILIIFSFISGKAFAMSGKDDYLKSEIDFPVLEFNAYNELIYLKETSMKEFNLDNGQVSKFYGFICLCKSEENLAKHLYMFIFPKTVDAIDNLKYQVESGYRYKNLKLNFLEDSESSDSNKIFYTTVAKLHQFSNKDCFYVAELDSSKFKFKKMCQVTLDVDDDNQNYRPQIIQRKNVFDFKNIKNNFFKKKCKIGELGRAFYFVDNFTEYSYKKLDLDIKLSKYKEELLSELKKQSLKEYKQNLFIDSNNKVFGAYFKDGDLKFYQDDDLNFYQMKKVETDLNIDYSVECSGSKTNDDLPDKFVTYIVKNSNDILKNINDDYLNFYFYQYGDLKELKFNVLADKCYNSRGKLCYKLEIKLKNDFKDERGFVPLQIDEPYSVIVKDQKGKEVFRGEYKAKKCDLKLETNKGLGEVINLDKNFYGKLCGNAIGVKIRFYDTSFIQQDLPRPRGNYIGDEELTSISDFVCKHIGITVLDCLLYNYLNNKTKCLS